MIKFHDKLPLFIFIYTIFSSELQLTNNVAIASMTYTWIWEGEREWSILVKSSTAKISTYDDNHTCHNLYGAWFRNEQQISRTNHCMFAHLLFDEMLDCWYSLNPCLDWPSPIRPFRNLKKTYVFFTVWEWNVLMILHLVLFSNFQLHAAVVVIGLLLLEWLMLEDLV